MYLSADDELSEFEVARLTGISVHTLRKARRNGPQPRKPRRPLPQAHHWGRSVFYRASELEQLIAAQPQGRIRPHGQEA